MTESVNMSETTERSKRVYQNRLKTGGSEMRLLINIVLSEKIIACSFFRVKSTGKL